MKIANGTLASAHHARLALLAGASSLAIGMFATPALAQDTGGAHIVACHHKDEVELKGV